MNKSVMKCCICNNENIGEFVTINDKKYHFCCIEQLQQENQELKADYGNKAQVERDLLLEKNKKLNKQLTTYQILHRDCKVDNLKNISKIEEMENQQKEFIEYMNKTIEELESDDVDDEEMKGYLIQRTYTFKEIFSKYKEIIGE